MFGWTEMIKAFYRPNYYLEPSIDSQIAFTNHKGIAHVTTHRKVAKLDSCLYREHPNHSKPMKVEVTDTTVYSVYNSLLNIHKLLDEANSPDFPEDIHDEMQEDIANAVGKLQPVIEDMKAKERTILPLPNLNDPED